MIKQFKPAQGIVYLLGQDGEAGCKHYAVFGAIDDAMKYAKEEIDSGLKWHDNLAVKKGIVGEDYIIWVAEYIEEKTEIKGRIYIEILEKVIGKVPTFEVEGEES